MKEIKPKSHRNPLSQQFKQKCKQQLKQDPKNYLTSAIKQNTLVLDISLFNPEDFQAFQILLTLPFQKLHISVQEAAPQSPRKIKDNNSQSQNIKAKPFAETSKFKDFIKCLGQAIEENNSIRILKIENIPLSSKAIKELAESIRKTRSLRQLSLPNCSLTQQQIEILKLSLAQNQSLISLDLSGNLLCEVGGMIGKILSEHSRRRNDLIWAYNLRGETPAQDISNMGLCEVNLQGNKLNDKSISDLVVFLRDDAWTKCLNLRKNQIHVQGVKQMALMLKKNNSLISLDLRENEGLTKQYSRYIYKKLVLNMDRYKQQRQNLERRKQEQLGQRAQPNSLKDMPKLHQPQKQLNYSSHKHYDSERKGYTSYIENRDVSRNNIARQQKPKLSYTINGESVLCNGCKQKTFEILKLEKQNLDLQLQLRKIRNALVIRNIDLSVIIPNPQQNPGMEWLSNRSSEGEDDLMQRMEQMMLELTRVMEGIESQQVTKEHLTNPLDNPNSFSNTIQLYDHNSKLQDLSKEIDQERIANEQLLQAGRSQQQDSQDN